MKILTKWHYYYGLIYWINKKNYHGALEIIRVQINETMAPFSSKRNKEITKELFLSLSFFAVCTHISNYPTL